MKCFIDNFKELSIDELLNINGGYSCGSGYGSGSWSGSNDSGNDGGYDGTSSAPHCDSSWETWLKNRNPKRSDGSGAGYNPYDPRCRGDGQGYRIDDGVYGVPSTLEAVELHHGTADYTQRLFSEKYNDEFGNNACALTSMVNGFSEIYTKKTGNPLGKNTAYKMIDAAIAAGGVDINNANIDSWQKAIDAMLIETGMSGRMEYDEAESGNSDVVIYALDRKNDTDPKIMRERLKVDSNYENTADHFVISLGGGDFFDPWDGEIKNIMDPIKVNGQEYVLFKKRPIRGFNYIEG